MTPALLEVMRKDTSDRTVGPFLARRLSCKVVSSLLNYGNYPRLLLSVDLLRIYLYYVYMIISVSRARARWLVVTTLLFPTALYT